MFCPNCGTQNDDSVATCQKCGFNVKGAAAPKFKGTMLMVNAPSGIPRPGPTAGSPSARPPGPKAILKGTMLGVAPPPAGGVTPPPAAQQAVHPSPVASVGQGAGAPGPAPAPAPGMPAPAGPPGTEVNPLGGTMVADPSAMGAPGAPAFGGLAAGAPAVAPPGAQPGFPPQDPAAAPAPGWAQPQPGPAAAGSPPGYGAPMGAPPPATGLAPSPAGMQPAAPVGPTGAGRPIGKTRNPVVVFVLSYVCFVYALIAVWSMLNELKAYRGKTDLNPILFFVPILGIIEMLKLPEKVIDAKRMAGMANPQAAHPVLYLFFGIFFLPADLNELWQAASRQQGLPLPPAP